MAKAKAKKEKLVTRVVVGPKGIHTVDPKTGDRYYAEIGETIKLSARAAKTFERYLEAPGVASAKAAVAAAEVDADDTAEAEDEGEQEEATEDEGGGSGDGS